MKIPENIEFLIKEININKKNWKMRYCAVWDCSYKIKEKIENNQLGVITLRLPAFKEQTILTIEEYYLALTSNDIQFTFEHLVIILALFESLLTESSKILCSQRIKTDKWERFKKFFEENKNFLGENDLDELKIARETRNGYLHNGRKIDNRWLEAYKEARKKEPIAKEGDKIEDTLNRECENNFYRQTEKWHDLIVKLTNRIKDEIILI